MAVTKTNAVNAPAALTATSHIDGVRPGTDACNNSMNTPCDAVARNTRTTIERRRIPERPPMFVSQTNNSVARPAYETKCATSGNHPDESRPSRAAPLPRGLRAVNIQVIIPTHAVVAIANSIEVFLVIQTTCEPVAFNL